MEFCFMVKDYCNLRKEFGIYVKNNRQLQIGSECSVGNELCSVVKKEKRNKKVILSNTLPIIIIYFDKYLIYNY